MSRRALLRRSWVVVVVTVATSAAAYAIALVLPSHHRAESVLVVPPQTNFGAGVSANDANTRAATYADLIPEDQAILRYVARRLDVSVGRVRSRLDVSNDYGTSVLRVTFQGDTASEAKLGAQAAATAVVGGAPASPRIAPRSLALVHPPTDQGRPRSKRDSLALGLVLGLCLGVVLFIVAERVDLRVDGVETLERVTGCAGSAPRELSSAAVAALVDRWNRFARQGVPPAFALEENPVVALVPVTGAAARIAPALADYIATVAQAEGREVFLLSDSSTPPMDALLIRAVDRVGDSGVGEAAAAVSDLSVLVVTSGTRVTAVRAAVASLQRVGVNLGWALLVQRDWRTLMPNTDASTVPVPAAGAWVGKPEA